MGIYNEVPSIDDNQIVRTFKFPFQLGAVGLPEMELPDKYSYAHILSLMLTGLGDRVMHPNMGIDINKFVFTNMTAIDRVRLASMVSTAIEDFIPWVQVISVIPSQKQYEDGVGSSIVFDVTYAVSGQERSQQIVYAPGVAR